jgi:SAM-dependent methyltransferase
MNPNATQTGLRRAYAPLGGVTGVFSPKVADYVASRPGYPAALLGWLQQQAALSAQAAVADIGAGTGLLTVDLLDIAGDVRAIEPNDAMRAACDALLAGRPGYASLPGSAEATGLPDASVDLITGAQCFHWWDVPAAQREAQRVLRPGGQVALVWNERLAGDPLQDALEQVLDDFGGAQRKALLAHEATFEPQVFFGPAVQRFEAPYGHALDLAGLQALAFSRSYMPRRDSAEGAAAARALHALFDRFVGVAAAEGSADNAAGVPVPGTAAEGPHRVVVRYTTRAWLGAPG